MKESQLRQIIKEELLKEAGKGELKALKVDLEVILKILKGAKGREVNVINKIIPKLTKVIVDLKPMIKGSENLSVRDAHKKWVGN